jgi:hypothetical protein
LHRQRGALPLVVEALKPHLAPPASGEDGGEEAAARSDYGRLVASDRAFPRMQRMLADAWSPLVRLISSAGPRDERAEPARSLRGHGAMQAEWERTGPIAVHVGNLHRMVQFVLLVLAILAIFIGVLPVLLPKVWKVWLVLAELGILAMIYVVWSNRTLASGHRRWSDVRRYAERLRTMRATWPLGIDASDDRAEPPQGWTEWRARALLRLAGPPEGVLSRAQLIERGQDARDDKDGIVKGQVAYHEKRHAQYHSIAHRLEAIEHATFIGLVLAIMV